MTTAGPFLMRICRDNAPHFAEESNYIDFSSIQKQLRKLIFLQVFPKLQGPNNEPELKGKQRTGVHPRPRQMLVTAESTMNVLQNCKVLANTVSKAYHVKRYAGMFDVLGSFIFNRRCWQNTMCYGTAEYCAGLFLI